MEQQLISLTYISKSCIEYENSVELERHIKQLLAKSRANNVLNKVSGALLYSGGYFAQILEGHPSSVRELFEKIQRDPRHDEVTILLEEPVSIRRFDNWSMALAGIEMEAEGDIAGLFYAPDDMRLREQGALLVEVLEDIMRRRETCL